MDDLRLLEQTARQQQQRYWGKYRGFVVDNADPERRGRCRLRVPSVLGDETTVWALPCVAYGGGRGFGVVAVPPADALVVVEFLEGDLSSPMWTGTFWRTPSEVPEQYQGPDTKVLRTGSGHVVIASDRSDEESIVVRSAKGAEMALDESGSAKVTDKSGSRVHLDADSGRLVIEDANGNSVVLDGSGIVVSDRSGNEITSTSGGITVKGSVVKVEGQSVMLGGAGGEPLLKATTFMSMFNAHTHNCTAPGSPSGPPLPPLTPAALTTKTTAS